MDTYSHPQSILKHVAAFRGDIALVVVTDISGGTFRAKGALMAVSAEETFGYISAGCVDGDIIFQARQALSDSQARSLTYGEGSSFKDIVLPCGGTIEIKIIPNPDRQAIQKAVDFLVDRKPATLRLGDHSLSYNPMIRFRIAGRGAPFKALAQIALTSGFEVHGQSPDLDLTDDRFCRFDHLTDPRAPLVAPDDPWTAVILLFHDHDWEPVILQQALGGDAFYIGAMGSEKTQAARIEALETMGVKDTDRIRGPIGLVPAMRDAQLLAVSILAEVIETAQRKGRL